jgi:hypothetical protein
LRSARRPLGFAAGLVLLLAPAGQAAVLNPAWDAPTTNADGSPLTDLSGYRLYSGIASLTSCPPGSAPQFVASSTPSPAPGTAVNYPIIVSNTSPTPAPEAAAAGAGCFIATAAYGSSLEPQVVLLRAFRDRYLLTTPPGRAFVRWYYRTSPPLADQVRQSPPLRALVRGLLWPLVGIAWITLHFGLGGVVLVGATVTAGWLRNRRGKARRRSP